LGAHIRRGFQAEYVTPTGRLASDAQTAYALAIVFDLLEPGQFDTAARRLLDLAHVEDYCIGTGFAGTALICHESCGSRRGSRARRDDEAEGLAGPELALRRRCC